MIEPFYGEFLLHPAPLEISGNTCSHNCCYCFSNIRRSARYADTKGFCNQMRKKGESKTFTSKLIRDGYSICLSNRTDPCSKTNIAETDTILKYLVNEKNGIFVQTKGGDNFYKVVDFLKSNGKDNVVFYFTITSRNEGICKKIEPGAPIYSERLKQIEYAKKHGYSVICAFNPIVEEWMPRNDYDETFSEMTGLGVRHFIYQRLHMTGADVKKFTEQRLKRFDDGILDKACRKKNNGQSYLQELLLSKMDSGVNVLAFGMPYKTDFFTEIRLKLGLCFPSMYDFINYCFDSGKNVFTFDDFINSLDVMNKTAFTNNYNGLSAYILRVARQVWKGNDEAQGVKNMIDVLRIYWNDKRISGSPQNNLLFQRIDGSDCALYFDGNIHRESRTIKM